MRDNLIVGLILGAILAWLFFNKTRSMGAMCRALDRVIAPGDGSSSNLSPTGTCGPIGGHWRPQPVTQSPGQPPTNF
jgi:hypothetical protein